MTNDTIINLKKINPVVDKLLLSKRGKFTMFINNINK